MIIIITTLCWVITQRVVVILYGNFVNFRTHLLGSRIKKVNKIKERNRVTIRVTQVCVRLRCSYSAQTFTYINTIYLPHVALTHYMHHRHIVIIASCHMLALDRPLSPCILYSCHFALSLKPTVKYNTILQSTLQGNPLSKPTSV
jgi:hypothetical protein